MFFPSCPTHNQGNNENIDTSNSTSIFIGQQEHNFSNQQFSPILGFYNK